LLKSENESATDFKIDAAVELDEDTHEGHAALSHAFCTASTCLNFLSSYQNCLPIAPAAALIFLLLSPFAHVLGNVAGSV
jgi:hypothetical protein